MDLNNFLTSGHQFGEEESYQAFRFKVLNYFMAVAIVFGTLVAFLGDIGIMKIGNIQTKADYLYAIINIILIWQLRTDKNKFKHIAWLQVSASWALFLVALINVTNDEFRIVWFYVAIYISYMLLGTQAGIFFTIASIASITLVDI